MDCNNQDALNTLKSNVAAKVGDRTLVNVFVEVSPEVRKAMLSVLSNAIFAVQAMGIPKLNVNKNICTGEVQIIQKNMKNVIQLRRNM